jgi:hypothetical protein
MGSKKINRDIMDVPYEIYLVESKWEWYVGKTFGKQMSSKRRFEVHMTGGRSGAKKVWEAVQKHGRDAFSWTILQKGIGNHVDAETFWYDMGILFDERKCLNGYRPHFGGSKSEDFTPERRARMSEIARTQVHTTVGYHHSPETKLKISAARQGKPNPKIREVRLNECIECADCDMVSNNGCMTRHFKKSGHTKKQ